MKRLTSLTQLLCAALVVSAIILNAACQKDDILTPGSSLNSTGGDNASSTAGKIYLDLTKDQVVPGGITNSMLQNYLDQGYVLQSLPKDRFAHVQFKNGDGNIYYQDGWLKKGTKYLFRTKFEPRILMMCGNDFWPEVD